MNESAIAISSSVCVRGRVEWESVRGTMVFGREGGGELGSTMVTFLRRLVFVLGGEGGGAETSSVTYSTDEVVFLVFFFFFSLD